MDSSERRFFAVIALGSSAALIMFGWGFLQAGTGVGLQVAGVVALGGALLLDRSKRTILGAMLVVIIAILPALVIIVTVR